MIAQELAQPTSCRCGSPVVGWGARGDMCECCYEDAADFARDELSAAAYDAPGIEEDAA